VISRVGGGAAPATGADPAVEWDGSRLRILDQTLLPFREEVIELRDAGEVAAAIRRLAVRGAPLIGVAAAYGMAMAARDTAGDMAALDQAADALRGARPTAANLAWAVQRVVAAARAAPTGGVPAAALAEAAAIEAEEEAASAALATRGADLLAGARRILTHCNTGALAAGGQGTALAVVSALAERGPVEVTVCETRPLLQGARLTVWELRRRGIAHRLIVDAAAAGLIARGEIDAVLVGCDRVAANGDVANKVGTYGHALAARAAGIPMVVACPTSSIDLSLATGAQIPIEERPGEEVLRAAGEVVTLPDTLCSNPAFDVTPAELVTALVTERGIAAPPTGERLAALLDAP
jgi:methylthioribose-1-phosphate isomerase